jgi:hypothetical protein
MGIVNKRNAVLGWLTWKVGKGVAKKKAKEAIPHSSHSGKRRKPAVLAGIAALGGALLFWRKGKGGHHEGSGTE